MPAVATHRNQKRRVKTYSPRDVDQAKVDRWRDEILAAVAAGIPLRQWCAAEPGRPARSSVAGWIVYDAAFREAYEAARTSGADAIAEEALAIADAWRPVKGGTSHGMDGAPSDDRRLAVWCRLQLLAKWQPNKYGDRRQIAHEHQHRMVVLNTNAPLPDGTSAPLPRTPAQVTVAEGPAEGVTLSLPAPVAERIADETADDGGG